MNRDELIWAGGLFEGEGCITVCPKYTRCPHITLSSTDKDTLLRFYRAVGCRGSVIERKRHPQDKIIWQWMLSSFEGVQAVVAFLWFGLGERRKARAKELLTTYIKEKSHRSRPLSQTPGAIKMRQYTIDHREEIAARRRAKCKGDPRRLKKPPKFLSGPPLEAISYVDTYPDPLFL